MLLFVVDGDGTLNELINGIMKFDNKPKISFIPLGTVNDFARTIKMSTKRTFLSKNINESEIVESDIGSFNNIYFNYVAAFGAFTPVAYVTGQKLKKKFGKFAYFLVAFKYLNKIKTYDLEVETDDDKFKGEFIYGSVSNSKSIGGFEWFKRKGVKIDDGKFEVLLIRKPKKFIDWINTAFLLLVKKHKKKYFYYTQTENIKFKSKQGLNWTLDGEYGGRNKDVKINTNNKAINFVIPQ
ncbi:MAG: YegS/Rv2252/BmrU family lipid kinase [Clostridia bacterium]|nr:YegS/Rv2252/BmrU family lipid kinase [Clostridia bacterium]